MMFPRAKVICKVTFIKLGNLMHNFFSEWMKLVHFIIIKSRIWGNKIFSNTGIYIKYYPSDIRKHEYDISQKFKSES